MEERSLTPLTDEYLQSIEGMQQADPGPFFYTRLKGRMLEQQNQSGYFYKPAWMIFTLGLFLTINTWILMKQKQEARGINESMSSVQAFAETYNLNSNSNY